MNCVTNTYSSSTGWSGGEPALGLGEGVIIATSQTNNWVGNSPPACPFVVAVTANPLWTDTGIIVTNGSVIHFPAFGTWEGGDGFYNIGPDGASLFTSDAFITNAPQFSLIAFVGPDPYRDYLGNDRWGDSTYFPQLAQTAGGTNGYWYMGSNGSFTNDRTGKLWFGINDDAVGQKIDDNSDAVFGILHITPP
jgi:hypothetical protein